MKPIPQRALISNKYTRLSFIFCLAVTLLTGLKIPIASAQEATSNWSTPANLSHSGAASQPRLVASPNGQLQVFWWDRFDGLTTAVSSSPDPSTLSWSEPALAPIQADALDHTPSLFGDANGLVHAFWIENRKEQLPSLDGVTQREIDVPYLMHSHLNFGTTSWSFPQALADGVLAFDVAVSEYGPVGLAYLRQRNTADTPSGVYVQKFYGQESGWGAPVAVYTSIYYRLLTPEQAWIDLEIGGSSDEVENWFLSWTDPYQDEMLFSFSVDGGLSWSQPQPAGVPADLPARPRLAALSTDENFLIWEATARGGCFLYQQRFSSSDPSSLIPSEASSLPQRILDGLLECPASERMFVNNGRLIWVWGEGSANLSLAGWDPERGAWSQPLGVNFIFQDSGRDQQVSLSDLHAMLAAGTIAVVGADETSGEVWFSQSQTEAIDLVYAPPPPWSLPLQLSPANQSASLPSLVIDNQGRTHLVWSQGASTTGPGVSLYYARSYAGTVSRPVEIQSVAQGEIASQPALLYDPSTETLNLVWSGGEAGAILYSRASINEAATSEGWFPPVTLAPEDAAWPQIGQDARGQLYVLYALPLNEQRGLYLVRSSDRGESWSDPIQVFDAAAAGWEMVDHPSLVVSANGTLHVAWVQNSLPGLGAPQGIYYARSEDGGINWKPALILAGPGYDWPRLALSGGQIHLLYAGVGADNLGVIYQRWAALSSQVEDGASWSAAVSIPGWKAMALPFSLSASGSEQAGSGNLHLVAADQRGGILYYANWDGERWSAPETLDETDTIGGDLGVSSASRPQGGTLAVAWLGIPPDDPASLPRLFYLSRTIPTEEIIPPTLEPTQGVETPSLVPSPPALATVAPSPTPNLDSVPPPTQDSSLPLILGGGLAVLVVVGVFTARLFFLNR